MLQLGGLGRHMLAYNLACRPLPDALLVGQAETALQQLPCDEQTEQHKLVQYNSNTNHTLFTRTATQQRDTKAHPNVVPQYIITK